MGGGTVGIGIAVAVGSGGVALARELRNWRRSEDGLRSRLRWHAASESVMHIQRRHHEFRVWPGIVVDGNSGHTKQEPTGAHVQRDLRSQFRRSSDGRGFITELACAGASVNCVPTVRAWAK